MVVTAVLRTVATVALVLVLYFLLPLGGGTSVEKIIKITLGAMVLTAIIIWQVRQIIRSSHPVGRAVEALAFSIPLYMLLFATTYFVMAHSNPNTFGIALSRTDAMYFSSTVFTTVGFGDITAKSEAARIGGHRADVAGLSVLGTGLACCHPGHHNQPAAPIVMIRRVPIGNIESRRRYPGAGQVAGLGTRARPDPPCPGFTRSPAFVAGGLRESDGLANQCPNGSDE